MHFPDSPDLSNLWIEYLKYKLNAEDGEIVENLNDSISKIKALNLDLAIDTQNLLSSLANLENKKVNHDDWIVSIIREQYDYFLTRLKLTGKTYKIGLTKTSINSKNI